MAVSSPYIPANALINMSFANNTTLIPGQNTYASYYDANGYATSFASVESYIASQFIAGGVTFIGQGLDSLRTSSTECDC